MHAVGIDEPHAGQVGGAQALNDTGDGIPGLRGQCHSHKEA